MSPPSGKGQGSPPAKVPSLDFYPSFVRKITRRGSWKDHLKDEDASAAARVLDEGGKPVSMWWVQDHVDLRRAGIAMNEARGGSLHQEIFFLSIHSEDLAAVGASISVVRGDTKCVAAQGLHRDISLGREAAVQLCRILIQARRRASKCTLGEMKQAVKASIAEGCFAAVEDSRECRCGATRSG